MVSFAGEPFFRPQTDSGSRVTRALQRRGLVSLRFLNTASLECCPFSQGFACMSFEGSGERWRGVEKRARVGPSCGEAD